MTWRSNLESKAKENIRNIVENNKTFSISKKRNSTRQWSLFILKTYYRRIDWRINFWIVILSFKINDLSFDTRQTLKLLDNDISLFSFVLDINVSTNNLNEDLKKINDCAVQWKWASNQSQIKKHSIITAWKVSKYGVISSPYFPVFSVNTGKYGPDITAYLKTFQAVNNTNNIKNIKQNDSHQNRSFQVWS